MFDRPITTILSIDAAVGVPVNVNGILVYVAIIAGLCVLGPAYQH